MDIIREALDIDPTSPSYLRWKKRPRSHFNCDRGWRVFNTRNAGKSAKNEAFDGRGKKYFRLRIGQTSYLAHRIVYALIYGIDAADLRLDHIDGDGQNNNPNNLRLATNAENLRNRGKNRNNSSGKKGVCWNKQRKKWQAEIKVNRRGIFLGRFQSINEASAAYETAAREHFGEFYKETTTP